MRITKTTINKLFTQIEICRFENFLQIENSSKEEIGEKANNISICECDGINSEIENGIIDCDYSTDCTFGENIFGFDYADFTLDYIKDNENRMYITYARWN